VEETRAKGRVVSKEVVVRRRGEVEICPVEPCWNF